MPGQYVIFENVYCQLVKLPIMKFILYQTDKHFLCYVRVGSENSEKKPQQGLDWLLTAPFILSYPFALSTQYWTLYFFFQTKWSCLFFLFGII